MNVQEEEFIGKWTGLFFRLRLNDAEALASGEVAATGGRSLSAVACQAASPWAKALLSESPEDVKMAQNRFSEVLKALQAVGQRSYWRGRSELSAAAALAHYVWARALLAEIDLMYALLLFKLQKFVKGALVFRRSWKIFEECYQI